MSMTSSRNPWNVCKALCSVAIVLLLVWLCYEKEVGVVPDSENYRTMLEDALSHTYSIHYEKSFEYISRLAQFFFNDAVAGLFFIYAAISIAVKFYAISISSKIPSLSLILYLSIFFILHEYIQIRVGASIAFFILAIHYLGEERKKTAILCTLIAIFFHESSLILVLVYPFLLIRRTPLLMVPAFLVAILFKYFDLSSTIFNFLESIKIEKMQSYINIFKNFEDQREINIFNYKVLIFMIFNLYIYKNIEMLKDKGSIYFLNSSSIGISIFFVFSFFPVFSFRIYEYLISSIIILYPNFIFYHFRKNMYMSLLILMVTLVCSVFFYLDLVRFNFL